MHGNVALTDTGFLVLVQFVSAFTGAEMPVHVVVTDLQTAAIRHVARVQLCEQKYMLSLFVSPLHFCEILVNF